MGSLKERTEYTKDGQDKGECRHGFGEPLRWSASGLNEMRDILLRHREVITVVSQHRRPSYLAVGQRLGDSAVLSGSRKRKIQPI
jgi:hypothetical protein